MRVSSIALKNFKRFTDLTIRELPESARIVLVVGPNGSGKSSLFDALAQWYRIAAGLGWDNDETYYRKDVAAAFSTSNSVKVAFHGAPQPRKGCVHIRSAYRNEASFSVEQFRRPPSPEDAVKHSKSIENDVSVSENYQRLVYDTMSGVYSETNDVMTVKQLREKLIGELRESMEKVFGDLKLKNIADPLGDGTFRFERGTAKSYLYKNLSGGEKAGFDLLLDVHVRKRHLTDGLLCIDEMETHLHTKVQGALLIEIARILPQQTQLWLTTHSLGVLRAAQELQRANRDSVAIIDFHGVEPDEVTDLVPSSLDRVAWGKIMSIALDDLSPRIAPRFAVVCEGSSVGSRRKDFDAEIYDRILGRTQPEVVFVAGGSSNQVAATGASVAATLQKLVPTAKVFPLRDRDDLSAAEVAQFEAQGGFVLGARNLESYLFADDVLEALAAQANQPGLLPDLKAARDDALRNCVARGRAADDMKSAAGEAYVAFKRILALTRCGNDTDSFIRDTLAPLVKSPMPTFIALKTAILDRLR